MPRRALARGAARRLPLSAMPCRSARPMVSVEGDLMSIDGLNESLAGAVAAAAPSVLRVECGRRAVSGIAWSEDGIVITASHAIHPRAEARVAGDDGVEHDAELLGRDRATDIA